MSLTTRTPRVAESPAASSRPLTATVFEILLSLVDGPLHGYAVMQQVEERTGGRIRLLPGTLYRAVHRMIQEGLIEEDAARPGNGDDDQRRIYYLLTEAGRESARAEAERLAATVSFARARNLIGREG